MAAAVTARVEGVASRPGFAGVMPMSDRASVEDLIRTLPLPLAQLCRRALNARESLERHQAAYFLWEASLKLLASVAVVAYAERGTPEPRLADRLTNLARPSLGHWWEFVRLLVPVLADDGDAFRKLKDLLFGRPQGKMEQVAALDNALKEDLDGSGGGGNKVRIQELFDRLVRYRNRELGHGAVGQRPAAFYERMADLLLGAMTELLPRLDVLAGRRLVYVVKVWRHRHGDWLVARDELTGEMARRSETLNLPQAQVLAGGLPYSDCLCLEGPASGGEGAGPPIVSLWTLRPLVVYDDQAGEVFFLNARRGLERLEYLSYKTGRVVEREEMAGEQRDLLTRVLGIPVDAHLTAQWGARAEAEEEDRTPPSPSPPPPAPAPKPLPAAILPTPPVATPAGPPPPRNAGKPPSGVRPAAKAPPPPAKTPPPGALARPPEAAAKTPLLGSLPRPPAAVPVPAADPTEGMRVTLTATAGPHRGRSYTFARHDTFLVGRSRRAHFQLPDDDEYVSRLHFMIEVNPPQCHLLDMGTKNGTAVNGQKVTQADLKDGDLIGVGKTILRVSVEGGSAPPRPQPPAAVTSTARAVPGYDIVRELGRGEMGVVYLARRQVDGQVFALKVVLPQRSGSGAEVERFLREAGALRRLDHPHLVALRDLGDAGGQLYFASDYVASKDLGQYLTDHGPMSVARAVGLICQLLQALSYAHGQGVVHGEIKPADLLLLDPPPAPSPIAPVGTTLEVGPGEILRLTDCGLSHLYRSSPLCGLTLRAGGGIRLAFTAPEQLTRFQQAEPASDQYAAAAVLYFLVTGRLIYDLPRALPQQILTVLQEEPVRLEVRRPDLRGPLADGIHRALAREPASRFPDVGALRAALLSSLSSRRAVP
jgi:pSer/pThr/pTyr-binding forkhead associated (FHA) protein